MAVIFELGPDFGIDGDPLVIEVGVAGLWGVSADRCVGQCGAYLGVERADLVVSGEAQSVSQMVELGDELGKGHAICLAERLELQQYMA